MDQPLAASRAKLARALEHLEAIEIERALFLVAKPYEVVDEFDAKTSSWVFRLKVNRSFDDVRLAVLIGDFAHNVRSALDHLVWHLVEHAGTDKPGKHTQFPIFFSPYGNRKDGADGYIKGGRGRMLKGVLAEHEAIIERAQPYHRKGNPFEHPLWRLSLISNRDKHRLPVVTLGVLEGIKTALFTCNADAEPVETVFAMDPWVEDGTELVRAYIRVLGSKPEVRMHGHLTLDVTLGDGASLVDTLVAIYKAASLVVAEFEAAFATPRPVTH